MSAVILALDFLTSFPLSFKLMLDIYLEIHILFMQLTIFLFLVSQLALYFLSRYLFSLYLFF